MQEHPCLHAKRQGLKHVNAQRGIAPPKLGGPISVVAFAMCFRFSASLPAAKLDGGCMLYQADPADAGPRRPGIGRVSGLNSRVTKDHVFNSRFIFLDRC